MSQKQHVITRGIATIIGVLSVFWSLLASLFSLVDPVAPIFVYFAIPFVLLSTSGYKSSLIIKLFATLFVLSHCLAYWTALKIEDRVTIVKHTKPVNDDVFIKCSNAMFSSMKIDPKKTTLQQETDFNTCVNEKQ